MERIVFTVVGPVVLVGILTLTHPRLAYPSVRPAAAAAAQSDQHPSASPLAQITVRARRELAHRVRRFVSKVTGSLVSDDAVQLWHAPLCPAIVGIPRSTGELVLAHMERTMRGFGVPLGQIGCRPNFIVVVTSQPEALLKAMSTRWPWVFGHGMEVQPFIDTARPVRIWYNAGGLVDEYFVPAMTVTWGGLSTGGVGLGPAGADGDVTGAALALGQNSLPPTSPLSSYWGIRPLASVMAFVDVRRIVGFNLLQITDYVVMAGLTRVNLDANFGDAPTILRLFSATGKDRPVGLSDWDEALLTELYSTDPYSRLQRIDVSLRLSGEVAP
jgi:hypothetical protein